MIPPNCLLLLPIILHSTLSIPANSYFKKYSDDDYLDEVKPFVIDIIDFYPKYVGNKDVDGIMQDIIKVFSNSWIPDQFEEIRDQMDRISNLLYALQEKLNPTNIPEITKSISKIINGLKHIQGELKNASMKSEKEGLFNNPYVTSTYSLFDRLFYDNKSDQKSAKQKGNTNNMLQILFGGSSTTRPPKHQMKNPNQNISDTDAFSNNSSIESHNTTPTLLEIILDGPVVKKEEISEKKSKSDENWEDENYNFI